MTIFLGGKMISIDGKSPNKAIQQLHNAKFYLVDQSLIKDVKIKPLIRNIVVYTKQDISIDKLSSRIAGTSYDPEIFIGMILEGLSSCSFLIFTFGKVVIAGAKSTKEWNTSLFDLISRINNEFKQKTETLRIELVGNEPTV